MIDAARFAQVLIGLRLILRLEPEGVSYFEKNYQGFIRSFFPALALAPLQIMHVGLVYARTETPPGLSVYIITESLAYVVSWTLFPFAMIYITRWLGCSEKYFAHIVPYNWFQLLAGLIILPLTLLVDVQVLGVEGAAVLNFFILGAFLVYGTFMARTGLEVVTSTAIGIVILDVLLNLISNELIGKIY